MAPVAIRVSNVAFKEFVSCLKSVAAPPIPTNTPLLDATSESSDSPVTLSNGSNSDFAILISFSLIVGSIFAIRIS